jgi:hypothetical protein
VHIASVVVHRDPVIGVFEIQIIIINMTTTSIEQCLPESFANIIVAQGVDKGMHTASHTASHTHTHTHAHTHTHTHTHTLQAYGVCCCV